MRGTRWILLVAIAVILGGVTYKYREKRAALASQNPAKPEALAADLTSTAMDWEYEETDHQTGRRKFSLKAGGMETVNDPSRVDLKKVTMKIYAKDGNSYDLVKSAAATFDKVSRNLFSQGETEITVGLPLAGEPARAPTVIKTSGVSFDSNTNRADTDQPSTFVFARGEGKATGATYDPNTHELLMKHAVEVYWKPPKPGAKPMKIEADGLAYHEATGEIWLKPWGRLTRENTVVEGNEVVVQLLEHQIIHHVTALRAHGTDDYPNRKLRYAADEMAMDFDEEGKARKVTGDKNAQLVSGSDTAETTVNADHVDLDLDTSSGESVLTRVSARGNGVVTSKPIAAPGRPLSETHILRSETFELKMRPGGREIEGVTTGAPGTLEFLPNQPTQHHRLLDGRDFVISYGPQNRVDSFHARDVRTQTDPTAEERSRNRSASVTTSRELEAKFEPRTSRLATMQQSGNFTYREGDRRARAAKASMEGDVMVLDGNASVSDSTGATAADHIRLDQRSGDFSAEGKVMSSRLPERDQKKSSEMLSGDEPLQATARKMETRKKDPRDKNRAIHYEGAVHLWQGANQIHADVVDIDHDKHTLVADGHVVTNLWDEPKDDQKKKTATPVLTEVRAAHMDYSEQNRLTHYTGGVQLSRPGLRVKSSELRAYLAEGGADSRLEKSYADGNVEILSTAKDRTRTGTGEHAEFYTDDQRVILKGPWVRLIQKVFSAPKPETSEGTELTYYANDDRLLVTGAPDKPGNTRITQKKGK